ncbi:MAG: NADH-quinone oxidoreductase subunit D [Desulfurococcales archaeon ex4484_58]|nr:MAG: NADH-quinone oxidoreductase subunit D [Desulfurococcales archaeon ex4484_58]
MGAKKVIEVPYVVELPVGPQHPALHEPLLLKAYAEGEEIVKVEINTGYNHRGIEKLAERNNFYRNIFICGRVCGICNTVHANCYTRALEYLLGVEPNNRAKYLRVVAMEFERIHSHMLINAIMAEILGFDSLFMNMMLDRERIMKAKEILTGNRVIGDYMMVGGVRRDVDEVKRDKLIKLLKQLRPRVEYYKKLFIEDETILKRLVDTGLLSRVNATKYSFVGPVARGSNVRIDVRASDKYDAYGDIPWNVITYKEGDSWARMMVRWDETLEAIDMCIYALEHLPSDGNPVPDERRLPRKFPEGESYARVEAQRGELTYYVMSTGGVNPYRVKIRTPSFLNVIHSAILYPGYSIADLPVIFVSLDPCIACMERVAVVDVDEGRRRLVRLKDLAKGVY